MGLLAERAGGVGGLRNWAAGRVVKRQIGEPIRTEGLGQGI